MPSRPGVRWMVSMIVSLMTSSWEPTFAKVRLASRAGNPTAWRSWSAGVPNSRTSGGSGRASAGSGTSGRTPVGSVSSSAVITSAPVTSSIAAMCILAYSATRPSASPSMTHSSHSGRERSSGMAWAWATRSASSREPPGAATACRRRWNSKSKPRARPHDGRPSPSGVSTTTRRAEAISARRASSWVRTTS